MNQTREHGFLDYLPTPIHPMDTQGSWSTFYQEPGTTKVWICRFALGVAEHYLVKRKLRRRLLFLSASVENNFTLNYFSASPEQHFSGVCIFHVGGNYKSVPTNLNQADKFGLLKFISFSSNKFPSFSRNKSTSLFLLNIHFNE